MRIGSFVPVTWNPPVPLVGPFLSKIQDLCNFTGQIAQSVLREENVRGSLVELRYISPSPFRRSMRIIAYEMGSLFLLLLCRKKCPERTALQVSILFTFMLPILIPAFTTLYRKFMGSPVVASTIIEGDLVKEIVGEWSTNLQIRLPNGQMVLWKEGQPKENLSEVSASPLAAYLTGGAVPVACMGRRKDEHSVYQEGTFQPFLDLDTGPFTALVEGEIFNFDFLNEKQIHQLFCHVIADCIIFNFDTHQGQYGLNREGGVISLDKGQAFALFDLHQDPVDYLDLGTDRHLTDSVVSRRGQGGEKLYVRVSSSFAEEMKRRPRISPENRILQDFFERCENISQERVEAYLNRMAEEFYPGKEKAFISFMLSRIRSIKPVVYRYFGWEFS